MARKHSGIAFYFGWAVGLTVAAGMAVSRAYSAETDHATTASSPAAADFDVITAVSNKLFNDQYFQPRSIQIQSVDGFVTLTGAVSSLRGKTRAVQAAESIRGVKSVIDRLTVATPSKSDDQLKSDVATALQLDPTTKLYPIQVTADNGNVVLTGIVNSWAKKDLAQWVVGGVSGVREVQNDMSVKPTVARSDADIVKDVQGMLKQDPWVNSQNILVSVSDGKVALAGTVASPVIKKRAISDSWVAGVSGVKSDAITVAGQGYQVANAPKKAARPSDEALKGNIRAAFFFDPRIEAVEPQIAVFNRIVNLNGTVGSVIARQAADEDARNTEGVVAVENHLIVQPPSTRSDAQVAKDIHTTLKLDAPSIVNDVQAAVQGGRARLSGNVATPYEKWLAWDAASRVSGVTDINNQVRVNPTVAQISEPALKNSVSQSLKWDPFIDPSSRIQVKVKQGAVTLTGQVDTLAERLSAAQDAFSAGATTVTNKLQVFGNPGPTITYLNSAFPVWTPIGPLYWPTG